VTAESGPKRPAAPLHSALTWNAVAECEHFLLARHVLHGILRVTRISDAYPDVRALGQAHDWLLKAFETFERPKMVLVWDGRRGKLRNDPEFERAMARYLPLVTAGWREFISLNNTPVVKVQFFRWAQERISSPIRAFNDEREAFEHALDVSAGRSPARSSSR
jgi:hypothetical protein